MRLTLDDVQKIGRLARIKLSDEDILGAKGELEGILDWIGQLQSIDVTHVDLSANGNLVMHERPDEVFSDAKVSDILGNAPKAQHDMFAVPKVVE